MLTIVDSKNRVCVHENESVQLITIQVAADIEVIVSPAENLATLFYNDVDIEFVFNIKTAKIINKMMNVRPAVQIWYMQLLRNYAV